MNEHKVFSPEFPAPPDAPADESHVPASINEVPSLQSNLELTAEELVAKLQERISLQQQLVLDEASKGVLVVLNASIGQAELDNARVYERWAREESHKLKDAAALSTKWQRSTLQERLTITCCIDKMDLCTLREELTAQQGLFTQEQGCHAMIEAQWIKEKCTLEATETELHGLKAEVGAQRGYGEKADEKIKSLEGEKRGLTKIVQAVNAKLEELRSQWKAAEAKRVESEDEHNEMWLVREELEQDRDQLAKDVNLERVVARLKEILHARDGDDTQTHQRILEREHEADDLRAQMNKMTREHRQLVDDQSRHLQEYAQHEDTAKTELEDAKQFGVLTAEVERLRRQVHDLQQESADKEVKLLHLHRAHSKQYELELLKCKIGVKGTGGLMPAPNRIWLPDLSRGPFAFATHAIHRSQPSPVTAIAKPIHFKIPLKTKPSALGTSTSPAEAIRMGPSPVASQYTAINVNIEFCAVNMDR
ncbi:hypothetical protein BU17DRAFT_86572 [Hysterangium stoloniferum]|nr:hypothetical protein BU17DRAFT_86572 [Hysterangium stoloniferum]